MLRESLKEFADNFLRLRDVEKAKFGRSLVTDIISETIPQQIRSLASLPETFKVYGSYGKGNWVDIPWIAILDKDITETTQKGYGVVFEFSSDLKGLFINMGLGWEQYESEYGQKEGKIKVKQTIKYLHKLLRTPLNDFKFGEIDLKANTHLGKGYEFGCIYSKKYNIDELPEDSVLINDLRNMIGVYRELKGLVGADIFNLNISETNELEADEQEFNKKINQTSEPIRTPEDAIKLIDKLTKEIENKPADIRTRLVNSIVRSRKLAELRKQAAGWVCEICGEKGFEKRDGSIYAEVHHKLELASSRLDTPENTICVCPLCHRIIHYGSDGALKNRLSLKEKTINVLDSKI